MRKNILILFLFALVSNLWGQQSEDQTWTGLSLGYRYNKKISFDVLSEYRAFGLDDPISKLVEVKGKYKLNKRIILHARNRFSVVQGGNDKLRFDGGMTLKWTKKKWPISASYRFQYQQSFESSSTDEASAFRAKFKITWKLIKRFYFFSGFEHFYRFDDKDQWDKERFYFGLKKDFKKGYGLTLGYLLEKELTGNKSDNERAFRLGLSYQIKRKKKKKKKD
jgi:hypothetical protein